MSIRAKLSRLERRLDAAGDDCPLCRQRIRVCAPEDARADDQALCPSCSRTGGGVVVIIEGYRPEWAE
jgi:hypothetical protein